MFSVPAARLARLPSNRLYVKERSRLCDRGTEEPPLGKAASLYCGEYFPEQSGAFVESGFRSFELAGNH